MAGGESEAGFQRAVIQLATLTGWLHYHTHDARRSAKGFPDLVLVRQQPGGPPRVLFAELKSAAGRVRPEQRRWADVLGPLHRLWRPADWDSIVEELTCPVP